MMKENEAMSKEADDTYSRIAGFVQVLGKGEVKKYIRTSAVTIIEIIQGDFVEFHTAAGYAGKGSRCEFEMGEQDTRTILPAQGLSLLLPWLDGPEAGLQEPPLIAFSVRQNGYVAPITVNGEHDGVGEDWAIKYPDGSTLDRHGSRWANEAEYLQHWSKEEEAHLASARRSAP
jgi:hypothetical protein